MEIKYKNKVRLAKYIKEHNGIDVDPDSIFDVQVKRLHEYKRQLMNILHIMYLYNELKDHPDMDFYPRTFIFGAKAAAGYRNAKLTIKLINHDQHTRHYRFFREVSHEERLVHGNVLATDHDVIRHLVNLVNQQERRTMRQQGSHLIHIHQRFGRRVHVGTNIFSLRLRDGLTHFLGQTGVCFVTRSLRDNTSFDKTPT